MFYLGLDDIQIRSTNIEKGPITELLQGFSSKLDISTSKVFTSFDQLIHAQHAYTYSTWFFSLPLKIYCVGKVPELECLYKDWTFLFSEVNTSKLKSEKSSQTGESGYEMMEKGNER